MHNLSKLVIASGNKGKLHEINTLLEPLSIEVLPQSVFNTPEVAEPHATFIENALAKARHACHHTGLPALADDSGICVNALKGAPGVFSARYAGEPKSDQRNNQKLVEALNKESDRSAYYYCVIVLLHHTDDPQPIIAEGLWHGEIISEARGESGFGYDPYFLVPALGKTAAELNTDEKNKISHRGQALVQLLKHLQP
ncbi:RdgB/HAM1 family non-canonical purine NTP pyrophosphatase [Nitrosomonas aestuarii]|uniref:RdgB/HAM1 family non-canonical purine NTP pyrophosphatase n=1 Tax=Nitrosomonas aestuarii TaxID=52441 RepID=UPI000D463D48|nr:RdgB/HAM1 family non-canonical purine NTP pyrophosphatase [Nitrosomonas aestuarii]PTN11706.1 XTP/dITP diphosphohydrolase [Nitrosomonas aestuarii]